MVLFYTNITDRISSKIKWNSTTLCMPKIFTWNRKTEQSNKILGSHIEKRWKNDACIYSSRLIFHFFQFLPIRINKWNILLHIKRPSEKVARQIHLRDWKVKKKSKIDVQKKWNLKKQFNAEQLKRSNRYMTSKDDVSYCR